MEWTRKSRTRSIFKNHSSAFIFCFFFFFFFFCLVMGCPLSCKAQDLQFQDCEKASVNSMGVISTSSSMVGRRLLIGPGSAPPRCSSKCGKCTPCRPVHVSVPPGTPVTAEYYPEAWRCKCGNKYYIP